MGWLFRSSSLIQCGTGSVANVRGFHHREGQTPINRKQASNIASGTHALRSMVAQSFGSRRAECQKRRTSTLRLASFTRWKIWNGRTVNLRTSPMCRCGLPLCGVCARLNAASSKLIAKRGSCLRVVLSDIGYDLGKIVYGRVCDFDSEIHFGMSARTSSIDLLSSG